MKNFFIFIALALLTALAIGPAVSYAQQTATPTPPAPFPEQFGPPPPMSSGICTTTTHLYVLAGPKILQYSLTSFTLQNTVELPKPENTQAKSTDLTSPPAPPLSGISTDGTHLFVLIGSKLLQYSLPDLTLQNTVTLP
ncbi:MAG: hypothetical protein HQK56_18890 [Deltaproteobacteria bacterium]|nr:hypothetical protein [Deltaproteobacteria bacterium]